MKNCELSNHLGNVLSVVSDKKIPNFTGSSLNYFNPDVKSYSDYYPFGMLVPGRHGNSGDYRYGFNGKEKDDEVKGEGSSYDFGSRMHDPRVGRFLSIDPKWRNFESSSPYGFAHNSPLLFVDREGENPILYFIMKFGVSFARSLFTSRKAALTAVMASGVSGKKRDQIMRNMGIADGILSTVDVGEMLKDFEDQNKKSTDHMLNSKFNTFLQQTPEDLIGPGGMAIKEQVDQVISIIENWDDLDPYTQGQIEGIVLGTSAQLVFGGAKGARIKLPKLKFKISTRFTKVKFRKSKTPNSLVKESTPVKKVKPNAPEAYYKKEGNYADAVDDFNSLEGLTDVRSINSPKFTGKTGNLPDGRTVTVRDGNTGVAGSGKSYPTLQINPSKGKAGQRIKIRYDEGSN